MKYLTFKREMARAYAEGKKRMTRRVSKFQPPSDARNVSFQFSRRNDRWECHFEDAGGRLGGVGLKCPYGQPGDQLILGTTWATLEKYDNRKPSDLPTEEMQPSTPGSVIRWDPIPLWSYFNSDEKPEGFGKLRPGRFLPGFLRDRMPNETLKIVRAERVKDITEEDALLEGIIKLDHGYFSERSDAKYDFSLPTARLAFANLINRIHGGKNWNLYYNDDKLEKPIWVKNPWVWVLGW
jgi:hypothetical protein